jgi:hypothetical protein
MKTVVQKIVNLGLAVCFAAGLAVTAFAQMPPAPPAAPKPGARVTSAPTPGARATHEKAMGVASNVNVKLCVSDGTLKVNGWERDEVRVFVRNGRGVDMKVLERTADQKPNWVWIVNAPAAAGVAAHRSQCLGGESVEIDLPVGASVSMEARTTGATIDTVKNVSVKVLEGSINIRNVSGGVKAETYQGDVILEGSGGTISLQTTTGNIVATDVVPGNIGDMLQAKTSSGTISLQQVRHRQIDAHSITGSVSFDGSLLPGGIYNFKTSNGEVRMSLPKDTSCTITASYGFGSFHSALPVEILTEQITPGGKNIVAVIGSGESNVSVTTSSGSILIREQN